MVADYVLGPRSSASSSPLQALARVQDSASAGRGPAKLDDLAEVTQVGATALALLAGRPLELAEYRMDWMTSSPRLAQARDRTAGLPRRRLSSAG